MPATSNVTIHFSVWSDPRYDSLARILGRTRKDAVGCMAMLWSECSDRETDHPPAYIVNGCLDSERGVEALVQAGLAELTPNGARIRGCKGRIEWVEQKRNAGLASAKKRAERKQQKTQHQATDVERPLNEKAEIYQKVATDVEQTLNGRPASLTHILIGSSTHPGVYIAEPGDTRPDYRQCWDYCAAKHAELRAAGLDPSAKAWPTIGVHTSSDLFTEVRARLSDCISRTSTHAEAMSEFRHAVDVRAAQAVTAGTLRWFTPTHFITNQKNFLRCCDESIEHAGTPTQTKPRQAKDHTVGRFEPSSATEYGPAGEVKL